jgi:hypothetical protein
MWSRMFIHKFFICVLVNSYTYFKSSANLWTPSSCRLQHPNWFHSRITLNIGRTSSDDRNEIFEGAVVRHIAGRWVWNVDKPPGYTAQESRRQPSSYSPPWEPETSLWNTSFQRHLDVSFLINAFQGKINRHSNMDTVGIRVLTRQISEFSTFSVSSAMRHSLSDRCTIAVNAEFWAF